MQIVVNGTPKTIDPPANLNRLLEVLELKADRCAIELNRELVQRARWESTMLQEGDQLEIVQFVGGG